MKTAVDPIGPHNDYWLREIADSCSLVVAAWGKDGNHMGRGAQVRDMINNLHYLRLTKEGQPWHPLYLPGDLTPQLWEN